MGVLGICCGSFGCSEWLNGLGGICGVVGRFCEVSGLMVFMKICGVFWGFVQVHESLWVFVGVCECLWEF